MRTVLAAYLLGLSPLQIVSVNSQVPPSCSTTPACRKRFSAIADRKLCSCHNVRFLFNSFNVEVQNSRLGMNSGHAAMVFGIHG
ncbi:hypothetical protein F4801DRAFT_543064 [Xylaria longipes]|nr:hypothetical protein F4801DRAFT_543064 [Xylaria longipes]